MNLLPTANMLKTSLAQYNQFLKENEVIRNKPKAGMVKNVGTKIANSVEQYLKANGFEDQVKEFSWEFNLVKNEQVNAWCMPGGKVVFYKGIMPICEDKNGVAVVMGHEIAHAVARHGNERMSQMLAAQMGGIALSVALSKKSEETQQLFMAAYGVGAQVGFMLPYSRLHESEPDKMGLIFMAMAGYNPHEAVDFWQRMDQQPGKSPPEFLSTHPANKTRIEDLKAQMPEAMEYYKGN